MSTENSGLEDKNSREARGGGACIVYGGSMNCSTLSSCPLAVVVVDKRMSANAWGKDCECQRGGRAFAISTVVVARMLMARIGHFPFFRTWCSTASVRSSVSAWTCNRFAAST